LGTTGSLGLLDTLSFLSFRAKDSSLLTYGGWWIDIQRLVDRHPEAGGSTSGGWWIDIRRLVDRHPEAGGSTSGGWWIDIHAGLASDDLDFVAGR
jgi:hypothetical protein